jgi:hypothetical protein
MLMSFCVQIRIALPLTSTIVAQRKANAPVILALSPTTDLSLTPVIALAGLALTSTGTFAATW